MLRWSLIELADAAGVGSATVHRMEVSEGVPEANIRSLILVKGALEKAGIQFVGGADNGPGVRLFRELGS